MTGIEASLDSNVLRNETYSNMLHGIHTTEFSGGVDHNLVYSTGNTIGNASMNIEGPGVGAQVTHNTIYEPCSANDQTSGPTTITTEWDPQVHLDQMFPPGPPPFVAPLWGNMTIEFQEAQGNLGGVFHLGPGGGTGALLGAPLPQGEIWTIDYEILDMTLSSAMFPPTPVGLVEASLSGLDSSTGQLVIENQGGVLVGSNTMSLFFEFTFPDSLTTLTPVTPTLINTTIGFSSGFGELDLLKIPTFIPTASTTAPGALQNLANGDQWQWEMDQADVTSPPDPPAARSGRYVRRSGRHRANRQRASSPAQQRDLCRRQSLAGNPGRQQYRPGREGRQHLALGQRLQRADDRLRRNRRMGRRWRADAGRLARPLRRRLPQH